MIFSIISQQYKRQNLFADLFKDRNNILTFPLLLLLLSYCSVFKVQKLLRNFSNKTTFCLANSAAHKNFRPFIAYAKFYFIKFCKLGRCSYWWA